MQVLKPAWVTHDDMPIFSIDIHPDGSRFATGGQGVGSGRVVIWNMAPVVSVEAENDEKVPKILCQLDNHLACVNCVRWSYSGKNLATGGDDKLIMIWMFAKYPSGGNPVFGGKGQANVETWRCVSTLRGHHGDVLDMAWSPHDTWLATCSIDNSVIVWNAAKFPEIVAVLKGHTGLVKGVTWDPVGKYLSSQADDKSIIVWRTVDWQQETVVKKPFQECAGTTLVLRLSWSPDGQYLVSAHAMNGSGPTAQIIEREGWRHDIDFVGHRKAVTCVSALYEKIYGKSLVGGQTSSAMVLENPHLLTPENKEAPQIEIEPVVEKKSSPLPAKPINSPITKACTNKQIETWTSDGRRRITPIFIPLAPDTGEGPTPFGSDSVPFSSSSELKSRIVIERREDVVVKPNVTPVKKTPSETGQPLKTIKTCQISDRSLTTVTSERVVMLVTDKTVAANTKRPRFVDSKTGELAPTTLVRKTVMYESEQSTMGITLPLMRLPSPFIQQISNTRKSITVQNDAIPSPYGNLTLVEMAVGLEKKWEIALSSPVCSFAANSTVVAMGCEDGTVHVLNSSTGSRTLPTIMLSRPSAEVSLGLPLFLMCLTSNGYINVWDLASSKVLVCNQSIQPILISPPGMEIAITRCWVSDEGAPLIALSTGRAFTYSLQFNAWMLLGDCTDPVARNSQKSVQLAWKNAPEVHSPLKHLQAHIQNRFTIGSNKFMANFESSPLCTLTYLDQQLSACRALNSPSEYHFWLLTTVKYLLQEGNESKLRLICEELLGPTHGNKKNKHWDTSLLGMEKHTLLKDVLAEMSSSSHAQRLFTEFNEQLGILKTLT